MMSSLNGDASLVGSIIWLAKTGGVSRELLLKYSHFPDLVCIQGETRCVIRSQKKYKYQIITKKI